MTAPEEVRARALREIRRARAIQEAAIAMRAEALELRLGVWLTRLREDGMRGDRDQVLERALDAALSIASADCANIQLVHSSGHGLTLTAQRGFDHRFLDFFAFVDDRHSACGVALAEHRPVVVPDVSTSPIFAQTQGLEVMLEAGICAVKSTPLIGRDGQVRGMLSVHYRQPRPHLNLDLERFQALAQAVAALIDGGPTLQH